MVKWIKDSQGDFFRVESIERIFINEVTTTPPLQKYFSVCVEMKYHPNWDSTVELMRFEEEEDARKWMGILVEKLNEVEK